MYTHMGNNVQMPDEDEAEFLLRRANNMPDFNCEFSDYGEDWVATFDGEQTVQYVEITNL